jgi:hypothetical protein
VSDAVARPHHARPAAASPPAGHLAEGDRETTLLVEEATGLAWVGLAGEAMDRTEALALLSGHRPSPMSQVHVREREAARALHLARGELRAEALRRPASEELLLDDHLRVRAAAYRDEKAETRERSARVEALPRPDVIGVFVLLGDIRVGGLHGGLGALMPGCLEAWEP